MELFAVLEFLKNLRDADKGTNHTENIVGDINDEINNKVGSKVNDYCHRDVDMIHSMTIIIYIMILHVINRAIDDLYQCWKFEKLKHVTSPWGA